MDKKEKKLLAITVFAIILSGCTGSNPDTGGPYRVGQVAQNSENNEGFGGSTGVTHTHNGVAHTHRLPEGGLKHSHNIGTSNNQICQPCNGQTNRVTTNTGGNCHTHDGRRHCHPLPAEGANHQHNIGVGSGTTNNNSYVPPVVVNTQPPVNTQPQVNNNTYYDYTNPSTTDNPNYYGPAPTGKGAIPHPHNGQYHTHTLPASGINHNHSGGTSFNGSTGSSSFYNSNNSNNSSSYEPYNGATQPSSNDNNSFSSGSCDTASGNYYIVKPKDGVYRIGVNNGVKRNDIIRLNNLQAPGFTIQPGQCLRLR